jgi:hypothetical protein
MMETWNLTSPHADAEAGDLLAPALLLPTGWLSCLGVSLPLCCYDRALPHMPMPAICDGGIKRNLTLLHVHVRAHNKGLNNNLPFRFEALFSLLITTRAFSIVPALASTWISWYGIRPCLSLHTTHMYIFSENCTPSGSMDLIYFKRMQRQRQSLDRRRSV